MPERLTVICLLVGGAALLPFFARRYDVPSAVLEILFGMVLFHTVLPAKPEWFDFLKDLGFIYLMFIAGMELDLKVLVRNTRVCWYALIPALSLLLTRRCRRSIRAQPTRPRQSKVGLLRRR